jgi:hypothetical protein
MSPDQRNDFYDMTLCSSPTWASWDALLRGIRVAIHVMTRGKGPSSEYHFFGPGVYPWWKNDISRPGWWRGQPSILVQGDGVRWCAIISAIPSRRKDDAGRPVWIALACDGPCSVLRDNDNDAEVLVKVVNSIISGRKPIMQLSNALDTWLNEQVVEELVAGPPHGESNDGDRVARLVHKAVRSLPSVEVSGDYKMSSWQGHVLSAEARRAYLQHVTALTQGSVGVAACRPEASYSGLERSYGRLSARSNVALLLDSIDLEELSGPEPLPESPAEEPLDRETPASAAPADAQPWLADALPWLVNAIGAGILGNLATDVVRSLRKLRRRRKKPAALPQSDHVIRTVALLAVKARFAELGIPLPKAPLKITRIVTSDTFMATVSIEDESRSVSAEVRLSTMGLREPEVIIRQAMGE